MSESRKMRQTESVHTAGLHMTEVGSGGRMRQDLLLDGDSSFGVKLQLQPSVSVWSRAHRHAESATCPCEQWIHWDFNIPCLFMSVKSYKNL